MENRHKTTGHCYIAAEAFVDKDTREIYDPTAEQYYHESENPPYEKGKPCGFLTRQPSKRCQILLDRVNEKIKAQKIQTKTKKRRIKP